MPFNICGLNPIVDDPSINRTYDDILAMNDTSFLAYVQHMRGNIRHIWDERGIAPARGWSEWDVREDFKKLADFPVHEFWRTDTLTGRRCIHNTYSVGNSVNAWNLSQMLKTRINYTEKDNGRSIYDFFSKDELFKRYLPYARRHFLRDSFYFFAQTVHVGDSLPHFPEIAPASAPAYLQAFADKERVYGTHEVLIEAKPKGKGYSGYAAHLHETTFMVLSYDELIAAVKHKTLPKVCIRVIQAHKELDREHEYHVRLYEKGQHIFPNMFKSFRVSMCQYAVNFPPLTAKLIYDTFLKHVPGKALVWDPSAGWAGRLLGAMASNHDLHYIGTDPNPAFYDETGSMYASVRDFYNNVRSGQSLFGEHNTAEVHQHGSEDFDDILPATADLVFTSPPYFNREAYSDDERQSYKRFGAYDSWRDGFLRPTITRAWHALRGHRFFLWNIADLKVGKSYLPLERDSMDIAASLGFEYKETILMTLKGMPGANRMDAEGTATAKNFCKVDGRTLKYEPVHVFYKPGV